MKVRPPEQVSSFRGEGYQTDGDHRRLAAGHEAVRKVLSDKLPHSVAEISDRIGVQTGDGSVSRFIRFLRDGRHGGHTVDKGRATDATGTWFYTMDPLPGQPLVPTDLVKHYADTPVHVPRSWVIDYGKDQAEQMARESWLKKNWKPQGELFGNTFFRILRAQMKKEERA